METAVIHLTRHITRGWRSRHAAVVLSLATLLMILMATPTQATILDSGRYEFTYSDVYDFCGFDIHVEGSLSGQFHFREGKGPNAPVIFTHRRESWEETWTANDVTVHWRAHATFVRTHATDMGDGIFLIHRVQAGRGGFEDESGAVLLREAGVARISFLWNTTTDEFVDLVSFELRGHFPEADVCAYFE
jgi:hypothetical protein